MKTACVCLAAGLILTGVALFPVSMTLSEQRLTPEEQTAAATACATKYNLCNAQCAIYPTVEMRANCETQCLLTYTKCMSAIARRAPKGDLRGAASPPSVAPPKSTPRKISPERVGGVSQTKATSTISPQKSASNSTSGPTVTSSKASPTPKPKPVKKSRRVLQRP